MYWVEYAAEWKEEEAKDAWKGQQVEEEGFQVLDLLLGCIRNAQVRGVVEGWILPLANLS